MGWVGVGVGVESGLKSLLLLGATLVLLIGIVIFEVSIYFGPD